MSNDFAAAYAFDERRKVLRKRTCVSSSRDIILNAAFGVSVDITAKNFFMINPPQKSFIDRSQNHHIPIVRVTQFPTYGSFVAGVVIKRNTNNIAGIKLVRRFSIHRWI